MAVITKPFTFTNGVAADPRDTRINSDFDTLYVALTQATSGVSHLDGTTTFTTLDVMANDESGGPWPTPSTPSNLVNLKYIDWMPKNLLGTPPSKFGAFGPAIPAVASPNQFYLTGCTFVATSNGSGDIIFPLVPVFPNGILAVVSCHGDTPGTSFAVQKLTTDWSNSSASQISFRNSVNNATFRINFIALGW